MQRERSQDKGAESDTTLLERNLIISKTNTEASDAIH
jgi:hypothetical protein